MLALTYSKVTLIFDNLGRGVANCHPYPTQSVLVGNFNFWMKINENSEQQKFSSTPKL